MLHDHPTSFRGRALQGVTIQFNPTSLDREIEDPKMPLLYLYAHIGKQGGSMKGYNGLDTSDLAIHAFRWEWELNKWFMASGEKPKYLPAPKQLPMESREFDVWKLLDDPTPSWMRPRYISQNMVLR